MASAVRENILAVFHSLSPKQRRLARFILDSEEFVAFASADELAAQVGTSAATVVRFARSLGYEGYPDLQAAVRSHFPQFRTAAEKMAERVAGGNTFSVGLREKVTQFGVGNVRQTLDQVHPAELEQVVHALRNAQRICIFAGGLSAGPALLAEYAFSMLGFSARAFTEAGLRPLLEISQMQKDDVVIGISIWRYIGSTVEAVQAAYETGLTCVALTDSPVAPVTRFCHHVLLASTEGAVHGRSLVGVVALVDLLAAAVAAFQPERSVEALQRIDALYRQHGHLQEE